MYGSGSMYVKPYTTMISVIRQKILVIVILLSLSPLLDARLVLCCSDPLLSSPRPGGCARCWAEGCGRLVSSLLPGSLPSNTI